RGTASQGKQVGVRHWELFGDINGNDAPDLIVGSVVQGVEGPLTTSFGDPLVITQDGAPWSTVSSAPLPSPAPSWPSAASDTFTAATFNVENLDVGDTTKITKVVDIVTRMGCPTFLAMEEVDTASTLAGDEDEVLSTLVSSLLGQGCPYNSFNSHPDFGDHGVAILWRADQATAISVHADVQGCSTAGSSSSVAYDDFCDAFPGEYPLFSRRPVVLTAEVDATCGTADPIEVTVIANHFKSQLGGASADQRRLEQGQLVASTVDALVLGGSDHVLVLGDLNDFEDAPPVGAMTAGGLMDNLWTAVAASNRYSYIFSGVSQILDHQLATPALTANLLAISPMHFDADFPGFTYGNNASVPWAESDHDPVVATFGACVNTVIFADGFESGDTTAW
ncbi:MAG: endonuclease/exonuclease/phosphatase family protein, partial [Thermoanaerobaculia bacterium]|nr:endonuclease/exonuclease/phosphatase family protein [Thermoanaerobaculia bacterium]